MSLRENIHLNILYIQIWLLTIKIERLQRSIDKMLQRGLDASKKILKHHEYVTKYVKIAGIIITPTDEDNWVNNINGEKTIEELLSELNEKQRTHNI